jgi:hypothetical protein
MGARLGRSIGSRIRFDSDTSGANNLGMNKLTLRRVGGLAASWGLLMLPTFAAPQVAAQSEAVLPAKAGGNGQHDFDFETGTWKTHLRRLVHPLTGSTTWVEYDGTSRVRKLWNGRANLLELEVDGPNGHIEALSLRLYNLASGQWSLNFSNSAAGTLGTPAVGQFEHDRGEFIDQEMLGTRMILVRFVISDITPRSCHFEQAFSDDGGRSWEVNWIADDTLT